MRSYDTHYRINGQPMLAPDTGVTLQLADLDDSDAGRDESGFLHRSLVRSKVRCWGFTYGLLSAQELTYLLSLLDAGPTFTFTDGEESCTAYCAKVETALYSRPLGLHKGTTFQIIEC